MNEKLITGRLVGAFVAGLITALGAAAAVMWSIGRAIRVNEQYPHGWRPTWRDRWRRARSERADRGAT